MKVTSLVFTSIVAIGSVNAAAAPNPVAMAEAGHVFCYRPGEPCSKMKRAAEAIAEAVADAEPEARHVWCYRPGEPCSKAKRDALALAEAVAEAHAVADPEAAANPSTFKLFLS